MCKVRRRRWVNDLVNARACELDTLVVRVTEVCERESVVTTVFWLVGKLSARASEGLAELASWLFILALGIGNLEGRRTVQDQRSRDSSITRAVLPQFQLYMNAFPRTRTIHEFSSTRFRQLGLVAQSPYTYPDSGHHPHNTAPSRR